MKMEGMSETVNLFDCLVRANTILFHYTTPDGRDEMVKFPLEAMNITPQKNGVIYTIYLKRLRAGRKNAVFL